MIYTVTLNPALDYIMQVGKLRADNINRSYFEELHYGGKGINVSVMLTRLGVPNKALGFIAGFTGERLNEMLLSEGVDCRFSRLKDGNTRINVKIKSDTELDINARGPEIDGGDIRKLLSSLTKIKRGDYLVLAGSVPQNMPSDVYERILEPLKDKGINFVVDACGESLTG
ncbi:MAG: 1-phosphofructokinase, partial [Clostridia bacterium]|nr:1-phosphofructokinase [Clostridia bacterium]